ncbi:MscL family protein [Candidatus Saccharibacteria bacterium]|nr:MscL family protein [Candidatus Saccharibacteria bacterium]
MAKEKQLTKEEVLKQVEAAKEQLDKIPTGRVKRHLGGFMEFVRKQGVVGLAVGLAIGTQAAELVKNIVSSVITPVVDLLVGKEGLSGLTYTVNVSDRTSTFNFGLLIDSSIKFLAVALVIYFVIMGLKLDKLDKKKD